MVILSAESDGSDYPSVNFGILFKPTILKDELSVIAGSRLGVNLSNNFYVGASVNAISFNSMTSYVVDPVIDKYPVLALNYIALELDYAISPESEYFPSFLVVAGYGNMYFRPPVSTIFESGREKSYNPDYKLNHKNFIIIEPQINLNMNFRNFYRIVVGIGYRLIPGLDYSPKNLSDGDRQMKLSNNELNGLTGTVTFKFGGF